MNCTANDINLSFDKSDKLRKTIFRVAKSDVNKAYAFAAFLINDDFKKYLSTQLTQEDIIKDSEVDIKNIQNSDYININQNRLGSLLNVYYLEHYFSVANSKTNKELGRLNGFSTGTAKNVAKVHTACLIIDEYDKERNKPQNERRTPKEIIQDVNNIIIRNFYSRVDDFARNVIGTNKYKKEAKDYAQEYVKVIDSINELAEQNSADVKLGKRLNNQRQEVSKQIEELKRKGKEAEKNKDAFAIQTISNELNAKRAESKELKEEIERLSAITNNRKSSANLLERNRYVLAQNLINLYTDNVDGQLKETLNNYANLVAQTRGDTNEWYFQVLHTKRITPIAKLFADSLEGDFTIDENEDGYISVEDSDKLEIDRTTQSWDSSTYKNFNDIVDTDLKLILSKVPNLSAPFNPNSENQSIDTNNELGVSTYMDSSYITLQISSFCNVSSVDSFIRSIENKANTVYKLYGLGILVDKMKKDRVFANKMFATFAKPIVHKTILTISDIAAKDGLNFDYSNQNSFPLTEMVFRLTNMFRATYNSTYNPEDINKLIGLKGNKTTLNKDKKVLFELFIKYFPNFNREVFNNYFDNSSDTDKNKITILSRHLKDIIEGAGDLKKQINKAQDKLNEKYFAEKEEYLSKVKLYKAEEGQDSKNAARLRRPNREYVDLSNYDLTTATYRAIINISKLFTNYSESRAQLNATNAEGNSSSNIGKNCYISRFFDKIVDGTEEDANVGLKSLLEYVTKGTEKGGDNQYSNNPLLFGLKDTNGVVIVPGIFTRVGNSYTINDNAKEIIKYNLFDGTKNVQENVGAGYASMSKLDFFITQYIAFRDSVDEISNDAKTNKIGNIDSAVYPMRIGSDAPKIFFIRAPKYNDEQVRLAFYNHVIDELTMFCKGLSKVFTQEADGVFRTVTSTNNLIGRAFFNEKVVEKAPKGTIDFTNAIVKDGKLVGNLFKFNRLFDVRGYKAGDKLEAILSLYGGLDKGSLILSDKDGKLKLNKERLSDEAINKSIVWNGKEFVLNLSTEQKEAILNIVNEWSDKFVEDVTERTSDFVKVLEANKIDYDKDIIRSYMLNAANMNMNYDDLFEGDYKYYNNARDFLKRTKETQAGGDGYAGYDITKYTDNIISDLVYNGQPEYISVKQTATSSASQMLVLTFKNGTITEQPMIARNGWRGVTIYNTNKASDYADEIQQVLERIFLKEGMDPERAKSKSNSIAAGYGFSFADTSGETTKINDAQSYITLEEFIRRRYADGTIDQYQDILGQLLDPNISLEDIDIDNINARIQVQKNFYYDKIYDSETGLYYPRQIKNAEFVLIPKLLPEGTELRRVYDWMRANDIGQLNTAETSKAAKKNIFTIWDATTGAFNENFENEYKESYVENYHYEYLYKQQDVPQHMVDAKNKAGIQIMKKIIDNVIYNIDDSKSYVKQLADEFQQAYTANIKEDFFNLLDSMGWTYDKESGKIVNTEYATTDSEGNPLSEDVIEHNRTTLNFNNFYTRAREEAARLGMDSNFIEYLIPNEFGTPVMPNSMNSVITKLESIAQAIYNNKVTRQTLPGWHAAQITNVGVSKKLEFNAETGVMQVLLPRWSNLIPKGKTKEENDAILKQLEDEGLTIQLAYRIPTEGKQSISVIKVVGFTNDCLGSTIVVPEEWVTQTGSDFDVDSIYGICWEIYKSVKDGNTVIKKVPYEEKDVTNENLYISFVNRQLDNKVKRDEIGNEINDNIKKLRDELNNVDERNKLNAEWIGIQDKRNELFNSLPKWATGIIVNVNAAAKRLQKRDKVVIDMRDVYSRINETFNKYLESHKISNEVAEIVNQYMDYQTALIDIMNAQEGLPTFDKEEYKSKKAESIKAVIDEANRKYLLKVENYAKQAGIESFEEFKQRPFVEKLNRKARNNYIIDRMIRIMNDDSSREEQYGRSKFDDITNANKLIDDLSGESSRSRSPYNPLDQLDYFEDAMGGARLKARSVNWDNFISKNNKLHTVLSDEHAIDVILTVDEVSAIDSKIIYNKEELIKSYDNDIQEIKKTNKIKENKSITINEFVLHSGGANGADTVWGEIGEKYGLKTINHYQHPDKPSPKGNINISEKNIKEGRYKAAAAAKANYGYQYSSMKDANLIRDWSQVKHSDAIFAIGHIVKKGELLFPNQKNDTRVALHTAVQGGTGYAVEMGIQEGKPVYVFDQVRRKWFKNINGKWGVSEVPTLTPNFAGIGTRNINEYGIQAIEDVYKNTINQLKENPNLFNKPKFETKFNFNKKETKQILFKARRIGWSENNKNIISEICTTYSSQTTAHHLDAVKMGSVPNVDEYTFDVYKFLSAVGIDYETVISYIRQPIIKQLVNNNNLINSIFVSSNNNPIKMTMVDIANKLEIKYKNKPITPYIKNEDLINLLKSETAFVDAFNRIFNIDISTINNENVLKIKIPLNKEQLFTRIKREAQNKGNIYENAAFDFGIILLFRNIYRTGSIINNMINVTNADKFGANASLRDCRVIKEKIDDLRDNDILTKDNITLMNLIYPTIDGNNNNIDVFNSGYPSIAAVYAYTTIPSLITNSQIFITESDPFVISEKIVSEYIGHKLTTKEAKEYNKYIMTYMYNRLKKLLSPLTVDERGVIKYDTEKINQAKSELKTATNFWNTERNRICGYNITTDDNFDIKDINDPKKEELERYSNLTPAQKVLFIKRHFPDNQGIFGSINVTMVNNTDYKTKGVTRQYLNYNDQVDNIEDLLNMFSVAFSNHNPLIKLAAIDLIKYAFIAEGFNFKTGYITKIVPNNTLYTRAEDGGMDIIDTIKKELIDLPYIIRGEEFINTFVRSHQEYVKLYRTIKNEGGIDENAVIRSLLHSNGLIHIDTTSTNEGVKHIINKFELAKNKDKFIRLNIPTGTNKKSTILYKVLGVNEILTKDKDVVYEDYFLLPVNPLDKFETYNYSYNANNNKFNALEDYIQEAYRLAKLADANRLNKRPVSKSSSLKYNPVGKYTAPFQLDINDPYMFMDVLSSGDDILKGGVDRLIKGIENHINNNPEGINKPYVQFNLNYRLKTVLPRGARTIQNIILTDGSEIKVIIENQSMTDRFIKHIENIKTGSIKDEEYDEAVKELNKTKTNTVNGVFYRVTRLKESKKDIEEKVLKATTDLVIDETDDEILDSLARRGKDLDSVAKSIIDEIRYRKLKTNSNIADRFIREMERRRINSNSTYSIQTNSETIYKNAARYYQSAANELLNKINRFIIAGSEYSIDEVAMYEALAEHDELFPEVSNLILSGITFGNNIAKIFELDITAEDAETKKNIESIINSINSVRQNKKLKTAMNNLINVYFKKYSTNPSIVNDLIKVRETFGDLDVIDAWIADPSDIDNNEVQIVLKQVYSMFNKAELFDAERNAQEWKNSLAEIDAMEGTLDINKIIDFNNFTVRQDYNEEYLKARQDVINKFNEAKLKMNDSKEAFANYIKAKYNRDKFLYDHTEQHILPEYYDAELKARKEVIDKARDYYFEYMRLTYDLYNKNIDETDEESANRKKNIIAKLHNLTEETDNLGAEKSIEEVAKARALKRYIDKKKELNEKYFESKEYEGFREDYIRYKRIVDKYDADKTLSLEDKLTNPDYKEAYDWIKNNGRVTFKDEAKKAISEAFKILTNRTNIVPKQIITKLRGIEGVVDEAGQIDGRKLTDEQMQIVHDTEETDYIKMYDNGLGEAYLINAVSEDVPIMKYTSKNKEEQEAIDRIKFTDNKEKYKVIGRINELLKKVIDYNTGKIDFKAIMDDTIMSSKERKELADLYNKLRNLSKKKKYTSNYSKFYEEKVSSSFGEAMVFYQTELKGTKQGIEFLNIITSGATNEANEFLFGYRSPNENFVDKEKTEARKLIDENIEFIPNQYYYLAAREASEKGSEYFNKWFKLNHIYNPYSHKYQPLKIWTTMQVKPDSKLSSSVEYVASFDNKEKSVKSEYINNRENRERVGLKGDGYKEFGSNYKSGDSRFDSSIKLTPKEEALKNLIIQTLNKYATTYQGKKFVGKGFLPRERKVKTDLRWGLGQLGGMLGFSWHSGADSDSFHSVVDYTHDREADMKMLTLIKDKGTRNYESLPIRGEMSEEEYNKKVAEVREKNRKIYEENLKIDKENFNNDWRGIMERFVYNATIFNSRQAAKPYLYLLLEDLRNNDAYMVKGIINRRLVKDRKGSTTDDTKYMTTPQSRTYDMIHNLTRRILFDQYHENNNFRAVANFLQNMTSAKYMIFNVYGGVANITTGKTNIAMEQFAGEYFNTADLMYAEKEYFSNIFDIISTMYSDTSNSLPVALMKKFSVVDFDQVLQFGDAGNNLDEKIKRLRNWLYGFQSGGEHYMQNSVLLAMMKSNRLFSINGTRQIGDFKDFSWEVEKVAMQEIIKDNIALLTIYKSFINKVKYDAADKYNIESGNKDFNRMFLSMIRDHIDPNISKLYKQIATKYYQTRDKMLEEKHKEFMSNPTVESLFTLKDGKAIIKPEQLEAFNALGKNPTGDLEHLLGGFKAKVISVNKKIHGVYDKIGAAQLENKWWGSLVMQYHKHLYTGIMKRWRRKGYYSEFRGSKERGSYQTLIDFLGTEFTNFKDRVNNKAQDTNLALASIQVTIESIMNTITNAAFNWHLLAPWEKANMRRNLGDMAGVLAACLVVMALYGLDDEDDINDDPFKASLLYLADRLYSDSTMYSPVGLISEYKTAWSSPIASANGPSDLIKAITLIPQALFDPDYNPNYQTGLYAGRNKLEVLFRRNIPAVRPYDRIRFITKNNEYYKISQSQIGINVAKSFGELFNE